MKLYSINCYGNNYVLANSKEDAVRVYLNSYSELEVIPEIHRKLGAKLILPSKVVSNLSKMIRTYYKDRDYYPNYRDTMNMQVIAALEVVAKGNLRNDSHKIANMLINILEGRTIYGPLPDLEHFFNFEGSVDDYLEAKSELMFSNSILPACESLLDFLGFWSVDGEQWQIDDEYSDKSYLYSYNEKHKKHIIEVYEYTGEEPEHISTITLGEFIDNYIR